MTLSTHAVVGAAVARLFPRYPMVAFSAAFISHFLVDAIPHGHYPLLSYRKDPQNKLKNDIVIGRDFFLDLIRMGFDLFLGIVLAFLIFSAPSSSTRLTVLLGTIGGVLPDALQFAYFKIRREPLISLQKFHNWIHAKKVFDGRYPLTLFVEIITIAASVIIFKSFI